MTYPGPSDPALHQEWRSRRRALSREHHPDLGGAPGALGLHLDRLDREFQGREQPASVTLAAPSRWQPARRRVRRTRRAAQGAVRRVRRRLPPGWPGARRYLDL